MKTPSHRATIIRVESSQDIIIERNLGINSIFSLNFHSGRHSVSIPQILLKYQNLVFSGNFKQNGMKIHTSMIYFSPSTQNRMPHFGQQA
jgi:hypothetical protein